MIQVIAVIQRTAAGIVPVSASNLTGRGKRALPSVPRAYFQYIHHPAAVRVLDHLQQGSVSVDMHLIARHAISSVKLTVRHHCGNNFSVHGKAAEGRCQKEYW
jgi:hypothetical protein